MNNKNSVALDVIIPMSLCVSLIALSALNNDLLALSSAQVVVISLSACAISAADIFEMLMTAEQYMCDYGEKSRQRALRVEMLLEPFCSETEIQIYKKSAENLLQESSILAGNAKKRKEKYKSWCGFFYASAIFILIVGFSVNVPEWITIHANSITIMALGIVFGELALKRIIQQFGSFDDTDIEKSIRRVEEDMIQSTLNRYKQLDVNKTE